MNPNALHGRRQVTGALGALALAGLLPRLAAAQAGLDMVKVTLGVPAGSAVDNVARALAEALKPGYAASSVVENKTGAGGMIAVAAVKASPPDGRTVLVAPSPPITIYPLTYRKLPYNPDTDLIPVSMVVAFDLALAVGPLVPASVTNLQQFFAWCKANPAKANFGSPAAGSMPHFVGSMTARKAGVDLQHVPYRGPSPALVDLIGGGLAAALVPLGDVREYATAGKCRILGVTGATRSRFAPDVPTFQEQGYGDYAMRDWVGAFLPAGTPAAIVQKLSDTMKTALADKAVIAALEQNAQDVVWTSPEELKARIQKDRAGWAPVVKALNFTADS